MNQLTIRPLTPSRWRDLETLFGKSGAYGGCWCMWFRVTHSQFAKQRNAGSKRAMKKIVNSGEVPGLMAYSSDTPVGWVSVAPREAFPALDRSRVAKRVDDQLVWSIVCFFVAKQYRRTGVTVELLKAAVEYARAHGAKIVEGYPIEPKKGSTPDPQGR
ncbi:MAG: GNAT family N-acetyltransferase [Chloroflexi bacterium]|nr:GNAT family N-acetyltransferase [Chloroflexota bacterium]